MTVAELLASMVREGGRVEARGNRLRYRGPRHLLSDEARRFMDAHRDEILAWRRTPIDLIPKSDLALFDYKRTLSDADLEWIDKAVWGTRSGGAAP